MEKCQRCGEVGQDRRTLWMACFYDMSELGLPFKEEVQELLNGNTRKFYQLRVCKNCRADWMKAQQNWFVVNKEDREETGSGCYVREYGTEREV